MQDPLNVAWDGRDFAAVQLHLAGLPRLGGAPRCRLPGGDMAEMEVFEGSPALGRWVRASPGDYIEVSDAGVVRVWCLP